MDEKIKEIEDRLEEGNWRQREDIKYLLSECERLKDFIKENYPSDHFDLVVRVKELEGELKCSRISDEDLKKLFKD